MHFLKSDDLFVQKKDVFDMKLLKKVKWVEQISKKFAYISYFKSILMGLLIWSNYKIFVGNEVKHI